MEGPTSHIDTETEIHIDLFVKHIFTTNMLDRSISSRDLSPGASDMAPFHACICTCTFKPVLSCKCHSDNGKVEEYDVVGVEYEVEHSGNDGYTT